MARRMAWLSAAVGLALAGCDLCDSGDVRCDGGVAQAYKQWGTVFPGAACVGALVDRFAQHCQVVDIDADSWRHKEASERSIRKKRS